MKYTCYNCDKTFDDEKDKKTDHPEQKPGKVCPACLKELEKNARTR